MPWAKLDDAILTHPKIAQVGGVGWQIHAAAIVWCNQHLTDGYIPSHAAARLVDVTDQAVKVDGRWRPLDILHIVECGYGTFRSLEAVGMWDPTGDGWMLHDFLEWNDSRAKVESNRKRDAARKQKRADPAWNPSGFQAESERNPDGIQADADGIPTGFQASYPTLPNPERVTDLVSFTHDAPSTGNDLDILGEAGEIGRWTA